MHQLHQYLKTIIVYCSVLIGLVSLLSSCEKEVHIDLGTSPPALVVQGAIETNTPPYVLLTTTISFFSTVDLATLENSFVHNAIVTVSDGSKTITLKEYSLDTGAKNNKIYIYSIDTNNISNIMLGEVGKYYTLTITTNGKTYTSVTKIPNPKGVDTMWFDKPLFSNAQTPDSALQLFVNYTDPDTIGNCVRYFTKRNNEQFYPSGIFKDEAVNGLRIPNIGLEAGYDDSSKVNADSLRYFYPGDTVTLKWCEIDKKVYDFWASYIYGGTVIGDPFATPINLKSNISNGALGVWSGYGSVFKTMAVHR